MPNDPSNNLRTSGNPKSQRLAGVRCIAYGNPSAVCLIGSMMACLEYLGDPITQDELFVLSGAALCFPWLAGTCCDEISMIPPVVTRAFEALGYDYEYHYEPLGVDGERRYSKEFYRDKIMASINEGRPVIAFGLTHHEPFSCVIAGYGNRGNALYVRTYWPFDGDLPCSYDPEAPYYRVDDWYRRCFGIALFGQKRSRRLAERDAVRFVCENALILKNLASVRYRGFEVPTGAAALDAMSDWILDDSEWSRAGKRHSLFLEQCGILLLSHYRSFLVTYLDQVSALPPECACMLDSARGWAAEICNAVGGEDSSLHYSKRVDPAITSVAALTDPALRRRLSAYVQKLRYFDDQLFASMIAAYRDLG